MPSNRRRAKNSWFRIPAFVVTLAAGTLSSLLLVKHLSHGSPTSRDFIPPDTVLVIRVRRALTSRTAQIGDRWEASLEAVKGVAGISPGLAVEGRCLAAQKAIPGIRAGYLRVVLSEMRDRRGHRLPVRTATLSQLGNQVLKIDSSLGAAPRIASPHRGSSTGWGSQDAVILPEAELRFVLVEPLDVTGHRRHLECCEPD